MKFALVADDGQARVVTYESDELEEFKPFACDISNIAWRSEKPVCKWHVCRREPSANGFNLVTIETWEKGVKL